VETGDRELDDPNTFPAQPWHLLDMSKYSVADGIVNYNSSYGCPFRCRFCGIQKVMSRKWNQGLKPERVLQELRFLRETYKITHVHFHEDNFFNGKERVRAILKGLAENKLGFTWEGNVRIDQFLRFDEELLKLITASGCTRLVSGAETASQPLLDILCKDVTVDQLDKAVEQAKAYNIPLVMNFIAGLPGDSVASYRETLDWIRRCRQRYPKLDLMYYYYYPIPGTPLFEEEKEKGLIDEPQTLTEWAEVAAASEVFGPAMFNLKPIIAKYNNRIYKVMTFYFKIGYMMDRRLARAKLPVKAALLVLRAGARLRYRLDFWRFPLEWQLARLVLAK
jgi:radical SAM superfamily enzyme YgiQ (UPF0313 family)